jgi:predicted enzyme involved in methoxymalonyl-ACP biosynthesis
MVHFSSVFPMKRLTLEILLVESEEFRIDRTRPTRRGKKYKTVDQALVDVRESVQLKTKSDLLNTLTHQSLPTEFDTMQLAEAIGKPRWFAQKVAYCLRETEAIQLASKRGNNLIYRFCSRRRKAA